MKTKLFFIFFFFLVGTNVSAQSASADSLLQDIQQARSFLENWDTIPGTDNEKLLAFITGNPVQVEDSIKKKEERYLGGLIGKIYHYKRYIRYDKINKVFKIQLELVEQKNDIQANIEFAFYLILMTVFLFLCNKALRSHCHIAWFFWTVFIMGVIILSYYFGSFLAIVSLIYIFKDKIRNFLQKRKKRKKRKESKEKSKK